MTDPYEFYPKSVMDPWTRHYTVTPSDSADLPVRPRCLYVNAEGTVALRDETGTDVTYNVTVGQKIEGRVVRVLSTGTTATVIAWY